MKCGRAYHEADTGKLVIREEARTFGPNQGNPDAGTGSFGGMKRANLTTPPQCSQHGIPDGLTGFRFSG